jgi:hypothetical protein
MKRLVETTGEGLESHLGEKVCLFCAIYIYTGILAGVNETEVELNEPQIVYETGELASGDWKDAQSLPSPWTIRLNSVESWGPAKC